ncbi:MAG TPA: amidohydrolase family protein [Thermomicrobiales bacterium]|nr:amidohydrolase family protein [Thermomicrobiales bacterium]
MIVDVHTHTPRHREPVAAEQGRHDTLWRPDQAASTVHTWDDHVAAMAPVDRAIVFNIAADPRRPGEEDTLIYPTPRVNDDTAAFVRAHSEKFIGFLTVHPHDPGALEEIERAVQDLGLRGIKLGPNYQHFDPLGDEAFRVFRRAEELGLPILFHQGTSPVQFAELDYAHPRHIDRVATAFPKLRMILAHMAHPWQVDCFVVIRKHPNVYADVSANFYRPWSYYNAMRLATEWGVLHKLLFGSDYPIASPKETMDSLFHVNDILEGTKLPRVPEAELEAIIHRDSLALLGLA